MQCTRMQSRRHRRIGRGGLGLRGPVFESPRQWKHQPCCGSLQAYPVLERRYRQTVPENAALRRTAYDGRACRVFRVSGCIVASEGRSCDQVARLGNNASDPQPIVPSGTRSNATENLAPFSQMATYNPQPLDYLAGTQDMGLPFRPFPCPDRKAAYPHYHE